MSNENESAMSRKEVIRLIETAVNSALYTQQATRVNAVKETSILHYLNMAAKSKVFLKSTADLGLAILDAGLSVTTSLIRTEVVRPSINCENVARWLWADPQHHKPSIATDNN